MSKSNVLAHKVLQTGYAAVAATLCAMMIAPPALLGEAAVPAARGAGSALPAEAHSDALTQQQKVLLALNRFTFGPRPGDETAVRRMGLQAWFQMQLHPESIDDSAFDAQMEAFPAMQLSPQELMRRFPSPQMLRQMDRGGAALPSDPTERAVYADAGAAYAARLKTLAAASAASPQAAPQSGQATEGEESSMQSAAMPAGQGAGSGDAMAAAPSESGQAAKKIAKKRKGTAAPMNTADVEATLALPADQRFQKLVAMSPEEAESFQQALRPYQRASLLQEFSPQQVEVVAAMKAPVRVVAAEAMETRLLRDISSQRQLQAVMTDFWLNHFNVYVRKNQNEPYFLPAYERDAVLPNALGKFEDLLVATAKSPAMLMYLDNWQSIGPNSIVAKRAEQQVSNGGPARKRPNGINENYARELMELHTLGVGGGYTQKDVIEVAKCFTGWTVQMRPNGMAQPADFGWRRGFGPLRVAAPAGDQGGFVFNPNRHEPGSKVVLGHTIPEGGVNEGLEVLHILATSPATARFISQELAVRFVSDTPPPSLVDNMAATFLKTDGDIKAVLTAMFQSREFWTPQVYRAKIKTPIEFLASALRASDATVSNALPLVQAMNRLGMPIYGMQTPNGYSWTADSWVSSNALISRMNFALVLSGDRIPGITMNWPALLGKTAATGAVSSPSSATEERLESVLLGQPASARTRAAVLAEFTNPSAQRAAQESFNRPAESGSQESPENTADAGFLRAGLNTRGDRQQRFDGPETPLDTMAGLLLGSPEFQRR